MSTGHVFDNLRLLQSSNLINWSIPSNVINLSKHIKINHELCTPVVPVHYVACVVGCPFIACTMGEEDNICSVIAHTLGIPIYQNMTSNNIQTLFKIITRSLLSIIVYRFIPFNIYKTPCTTMQTSPGCLPASSQVLSVSSRRSKWTFLSSWLYSSQYQTSASSNLKVSGPISEWKA